MKKLLFPLAAAAIIACSCGSDPLQKQVDAVYARLSLEEKAAQLYGIYPSNLMVDGKISLEKCREIIPYGVGHICQPTSSQDKNADEIREMVRDIQNYLMNETNAGIPAIFHEECLTGLTARGATAFPQAIATACSWDPELVYQKTAMTADLMRDMGQQLALSPMLDVIRNANWTRIEESCGEDGYLTATLGYAFVDGLQSKGFKDGVAATTKHFLGYGGANTLPWKEIYEEVLLPHEAIIRKLGTESVMTSYNNFRGDPAVCSDTLLNVILRGYLEYQGAVISDYGSVQQDSRDRSPEFLKKCAVDAIMTGNDIELCSPTSSVYIPELVKEGRITEEAFEKAVKRALMLKAKAGLLDPDPKVCADGPLELDSKESRELAYKIATESAVLLKNNGILPLAEGLDVAMVGPDANSYWSMLGDYTFQSMQLFFHRHPVDPSSLNVPTFLEAFKAGYQGNIEYSRGVDWSSLSDIRILEGGDARVAGMRVRKIESEDPTDWKAAVKTAAASDVIVAAMGENIYLSGENRTRNGIRLPGEQEEFVKDLIVTGKPVILVVFGGHPQVIDAVADGCAAVIQAWFPGEEGGRALTDIITGKVNPSGKLCVSYPKTEAEDLFCYNEKPAESLVAYPFGYGLSYTTFEYSDIEVQPSAKTSDKYLTVSCTVRNTGSKAGDEVAQLYVSPLSGQPLKPIQLKGYKRISLAAGESRKVTFQVALDQLAWWSEKNARTVWTITPGDYAFCIGGSSADTGLNARCTISGKPVEKSIRNEYFAIAKVI